jgi:low temperature requirement protein LtrA
LTTDEPRTEREQRVTPLELFFDLVVVFAITQVTTFLARNPTWSGFLRGVLLLGMLWWAWSAYAWLTNTLDPEVGVVRLVVLAAIATMLIVSLAAPHAYDRDALIFAVSYLIVRGLLGRQPVARSRKRLLVVDIDVVSRVWGLRHKAVVDGCHEFSPQLVDPARRSPTGVSGPHLEVEPLGQGQAESIGER